MWQAPGILLNRSILGERLPKKGRGNKGTPEEEKLKVLASQGKGYFMMESVHTSKQADS